MGLREVLAVRPGPLEQVRHRVEAEPVEPDVEPELDHVHHRVADVGVVVVQVGLMVEEPVPVELAPGVVIAPVRRFGVDEDDAGVLVDLVAVGPHVPVGHGPVTAEARLLEPRVLVGRVVHHQVGDDPDALGVRLLDQADGVAEVAVARMDREEVGDVVAAVTQRRLVEGQQPDAVDPEPLEVVELLDEPGQVAGAVAVAVLEASHDDLVEDRALVPTEVVLVDAAHGRPFQIGTLVAVGGSGRNVDVRAAISVGGARHPASRFRAGGGGAGAPVAPAGSSRTHGWPPCQTNVVSISSSCASNGTLRRRGRARRGRGSSVAACGAVGVEVDTTSTSDHGVAPAAGVGLRVHEDRVVVGAVEAQRTQLLEGRVLAARPVDPADQLPQRWAAPPKFRARSWYFSESRYSVFSGLSGAAGWFSPSSKPE